MRFTFTQDQEVFRQEVCNFLTKELTPEIVAKNRDLKEYGGYDFEFAREFARKLGARGYIGMGWPKEYGGGGRDAIYSVILAEEMEYHHAPSTHRFGPMLAPSILAFGTEEQKKFFIPKIRNGEIVLFLGYSEPEAGSDLANLQTRAVADGDDYIVNGQKAFSSAANRADYGWLAVRTDPDAPKHRGISLFIVDMKTPGITITAHETMGGWEHHSVFFNNVRVPRTDLVGELNQGWYHMMFAVDDERASLGNCGALLRSFDRLVAYCKQTTRDGEPLSKDPITRHKLADLAVDVEAARLLSYRVASMCVKGLHPDYEASLSQLFKRETERRVQYAGLEVVGLYAQLKTDSKWVPLEGVVERSYRNDIYFHFAAGGFDILRNVIAGRALGLPR